MRNKIFNYFEIAARAAVKNKDRRDYLLGAAAIRGDGTMVTAFNVPTITPTRHAHAEKRLASKLDYGATVYIVRVKVGNGTFGNARPCNSCLKALKSKKVKKIYYTDGPNEYGVINLETGKEFKRKSKNV
jgi:cytidine deaminase